MNTLHKTVFIASAFTNALLGILFTFVPEEIGLWIGTSEMNEVDLVLIQVFGSALLGLAAINFMSRRLTIGGIYGKPIQLGNLIFHIASSIGFIRYFLSSTDEWVLGILALVYTLLSAGFISLNFRSPV